MYSKKFVIGAIVVLALAACGNKESSMSEKDKAARDEVIRSLSATVQETAKNLAVINRKHDQQYYADRMLQIIKECASRSDIEPCMESNLNSLKYE